MRLGVDHVHKSFGDKPILRDLSFQVADEEFVAIVGPTGCGKTTILNIIAGFDTPTSGKIQVNNRSSYGPGPDRVMIFQDSALFPCLTVRENIQFGLKHKGLEAHERDRLASSALDAIGLTSFADHYPHQLSGGMRKLVEVVRATVLANPVPLLVCDEALGQLDALTRAQIQDMIQHIWINDPRTVLWVTHDLEEALYLADRILVLSPRPAQVNADFNVPFPRPRVPSLRTSPELQKCRSRLFDLLGPETVAVDGRTS